jgi:hypothetical protein
LAKALDAALYTIYRSIETQLKIVNLRIKIVNLRIYGIGPARLPWLSGAKPARDGAPFRQQHHNIWIDLI